MNRISALFLAFLSLSACARFRIEELQPSLLFSLNVKTPDQPNPEQFIQTEASGRVYFDLPARPVTDGTYLYVADPERSLVRVFSRNSSRPVKLYGGSAPAGLEDIKFVKIKAGIPGWIASDEDENIYVQIRSPDPTKPTDPELPPEERRSGITQKPGEISPSVIVHLNDQDEVLGVIGRNGYNSDSFADIVRIDAGEDGLLFVLYREAGNLNLSVFNGGKKIRALENFNPAGEDEKRKFTVIVEDIVPDAAGKFYIASLAFRNKSNYNLEYRKVFRITAENGQSHEILNIDDPDDFFAWSRPDGGFYLMRNRDEGSAVLFKIYSESGEYLNNRLISFPEFRPSWRDTFLTLQGKIFTSRLFRGKFELYEWK